MIRVLTKMISLLTIFFMLELLGDYTYGTQQNYNNANNQQGSIHVLPPKNFILYHRWTHGICI